MTRKISVAILEDHQIVIDGYRFHLQNAPDLEITGIANYYSEWEAILTANPPDCALMDVVVNMAPDDSRAYPIHSILPRLVQTYPNTAFLVISGSDEATMIRKVVDAGAAGYILKGDGALFNELESIIRTVTVGRGGYLSPRAKELYLQRLPGGTVIDLSPRQTEALSICAAQPDITTMDLARQIGVADSSARTLLSQAYARLGVRTRAAAIEKARQLGLLPR